MGLGGWAYRSQLPAFAVTQLKLDARGYGWLLALNGLGACLAALFVAVQGARIVRTKMLYIGAYLYTAFIILFGSMDHALGAALALFFAGCGITLFFSIGNSIIQTQSPDHLRGRLMGIWALVFGGSMPFGSLWMGITAQHVGSGHALQIGGLLCGIGALVVYLVSRTNRSR